MDGFSGADVASKWDVSSASYTTTTAGPRVPGGYYASLATAISLEALSNSAGPSEWRLTAFTVEVLTPAKITQPFIGWGAPSATKYIYV